uniref:CARD domain-containing protein n=1 Tax=Plectus sambesii TaxID=2011161 RepID=A0A914X7R4_9BILA
MTVGGSGASDPPMSEEHRQVLRELNALLCDELDAVPVARDLYSRKVLERTHVEHIRNILPKPEQNWDLLSKLERSGDNAFWVFMEVLTKKQPHLAHQIDLRLSQGQREKTMERPPTNDDQLPDLKEDISQL